jgi:hypothetical protein
MSEQIVISMPTAGQSFQRGHDATPGEPILVTFSVSPGDWGWHHATCEAEGRLFIKGQPQGDPQLAVFSKAAGTWALTFNPPNPGGGGTPVWPAKDTAATVLVYIKGKRHLRTRVSIRIEVHAKGDTVSIATPSPGTTVSYPFNATGVATGCRKVRGELISQTGAHYPGVPSPATSPWTITFNGGPTTECTLKVTNTLGTAFASEDLNPPPGQ